MSPEEALKLCRLAKAASPAQAVDDYTPELWALSLTRERFVDAQQAVVELSREQEWIHLSHIVKRVKRIRDERVRAVTMPTPPDGLTPAEYSDWFRDTIRRIADGEPIEQHALAAPDVDHAARRDAILAGAFRRPDAEGAETRETGPLAAEQDSRGATGHHDDTGAQIAGNEGDA